MKKILGLLSCIVFFGSCDDGKMSTQGITFDPTKPVLSCSPTTGVYYKINGPEALILQTPASTFVNDTLANHQPLKVSINNSTTSLVLRSFNATVTASYFCSVIPPSTPIVTEEWDAVTGAVGPTGVPQSGYIEITTTAIKDTTAITGYNHNIVFKNITFTNSKSTFVYDNYVYGNYVTAPAP